MSGYSASEIDLVGLRGASSVTCLWGDPHTDSGHPPWFVLWTVRSSGHTLYGARTTKVEEMIGRVHAAPTPEARDAIADERANLTPGVMCILSSWHVHWLAPPAALNNFYTNPEVLLPDLEDDQVTHPPGLERSLCEVMLPHWFYAVSLDFHERPTRKTAEAAMAHEITRRLKIAA